MATLTKAAIAERNRKFMRLGKKQRFVQVAKDALAQLGKGKYDAQTGAYFFAPYNAFSSQAIDSPEQFQVELLAPTVSTCEVCARGALFLSRARCGNTVSYEDVNVPLLPDAPKEIMWLLEHFFEGWSPEGGNIVGAPFLVRCNEASRLDILHDGNSTAILRDILMNVIKNRGDYVTPSGRNLTAKVWELFIKKSKGRKK